jgi:hypothetical protein
MQKINKFFYYSKTKENLLKIQEDLNYPSTYTVVQDISTRWNSSFISWKRLIILQRAITHLPSKLNADLNIDNRKDGKRLERIMLDHNDGNL